MFWELLATLFAGFFGAGVALLVNMMSRGRLPRSAMPIMAGVFMLTFAVWSELNWFPRSLEQLPQGVVVVEENESRSFYRPWTYLTPYVNRFIAVDGANAQSNAAFPDQRIVDVYLLERWQPARALRVGIDCAVPAQTPLSEDSIAPTGEIVSELWTTLPRDHRMIMAICPVS